MKERSEPSMLRSALWYARNGIAVFPCKPGGKEPLTPHGFKNATTDVDQIEKWWRRWPNANIGLPTGARSGLLVVDIDPRSGGEESWAKIRSDRKIPKTAKQTTGGGGRHIIFRHPGGRVPKSLAPGIDLKADGGYIVVAPSIHPSGVRYEWNGDLGRKALLTPADLPAWLLKAIKASHNGTRANTATDGEMWARGERNNRLASVAGSLRRLGCTGEDIEEALCELNRRRCDPPLATDEVNGIAASISNYQAGTGPWPHQESQATQLVSLAEVAELFHTCDGEAYAAIDVGLHREIWRLKDPEFKRWLAASYYKEHGKAPSSHAVSDALGVLAGKSLYEGREHEVFIRIARQGDAIYLDLGDESWKAVKITPDGWRIVNKPIARFRRPRGMLTLPTPQRDGSIEELKKLVNVGTKNNWVMLVAWIVSAFQFGGPFPVLVLQGEQGSAKSTAARLLRSLIDPNKSPLRAEPREVRDLMIAANNGAVVAFDNVSHLPPWLSDALCSLATGGGFSTRELYSDDQEAIFNATRPILLNGIDGVVVRGDLLDRSLILDLPEIPKREAGL
jgi:hypothetical protein